ncbi:MAG: alpha/beta hydrolase-fold protein [Thermomicrobiales bacterium]
MTRPSDSTSTPWTDPARFAAHEQFFVEEVRPWVTERFDLPLAADRTAVFGVSAGGELALALGLRHPDTFGAIFCASPGAGYRPTGDLPASLPRAYFVAGRNEPFFYDNAARWAESLKHAGGEVEMTAGDHGGPFWRDEFPIMVNWAFEHQ